MNAVRSSNVSLKYQRFMSSGCEDKWITKIEFVAKTQFQKHSLHINWNPKNWLYLIMFPLCHSSIPTFLCQIWNSLKSFIWQVNVLKADSIGMQLSYTSSLYSLPVLTFCPSNKIYEKIHKNQSTPSVISVVGGSLSN